MRGRVRVVSRVASRVTMGVRVSDRF
jgi:hypothetical protein